MRRLMKPLTALALLVGTVAIASTGAGAAPSSRAGGAGRGSADRLAGLPPTSTQIKVLEAAEVKIAQAISDDGVDRAYYGFGTPLGDLRSFDVEPLWNTGIDGAGTTIAVVEGWNDPQIQAIVDQQDGVYGLPNPKITTIYPAGPLPKVCPAGMQRLGSYGSCLAWHAELTLDVETVHLLAPYANIVISATPADTEINDDASAQVAPPEMMEALEYMSEHHSADVISISDGSNEGDYRHGAPEILAQDPGELTAAAAGIPVVDGTGDCGAAQELAAGTGFCTDLTKGRAVATWNDSPYVLAVGGNTPAFTYTGPGGADTFSVWNTGRAAEGAGRSIIFKRPAYQSAEASVIGAPWRSVPDITMDAATGTSLATPEFGAILALATQEKHGLLGPINQVLYDDLGPKGAAAGIVDVTQGDNSLYGVTGFSAGPGFDVATGWGTVDAALFVPALATAMADAPKLGSLAQAAHEQLTALERTGRVQPTRVDATGSLLVTSSGFLPVHPVKVRIDGKLVRTVDANGASDLRFSLRPSSLGLRPGTHVLTLEGMLLSQRLVFDVA